ncbi:hypothetical protein B0H13DRAFT_1905748 [Mycena leptocephala]|nr:hypothetical protein B0H13DRAFT_1905748 [Mycena leptocephala]
MPLRQFHHLMHLQRTDYYSEIHAVNYRPHPQLPILETLSKYSRDNDFAIGLNTIFAMGLVGAGTNNARLAQMLRQLAGYYYKGPDCLFMVRIAQGLIHMGKGTNGLNPFFSDRSIMSRPAISGFARRSGDWNVTYGEDGSKANNQNEEHIWMWNITIPPHASTALPTTREHERRSDAKITMQPEEGLNCIPETRGHQCAPHSARRTQAVVAARKPGCHVRGPGDSALI